MLKAFRLVFISLMSSLSFHVKILLRTEVFIDHLPGVAISAGFAVLIIWKIKYISCIGLNYTSEEKYDEFRT